jgi:hypothetical protein
MDGGIDLSPAEIMGRNTQLSSEDKEKLLEYLKTL